MESNQEARARVKEVRRGPQEEKVGLGSRIKKRLSKKDKGEFKLRITDIPMKPGLEKPHTWIWRQYRDEDTALRNLGKKYSFFFLEILNPDGQVIVDNKEIYEARRAEDLKLRSGDEL
jgi:hypothetical protein